jgi:hypothetical protein
MFWYSPTQQSWFWWGRANRNFVGDGPYSPYGNFTPVAGDFNLDGSDDIILYGRSGGPSYYYWMGPDAARPGTGKLVGFGNAPVPGTGFSPTTGDLDGNGTTDILWFAKSGSSYFSIYYAGGSVWQGPTVAGDFNVAIGRFDGDAGADILWYNPRQSYVWVGMCCAIVSLSPVIPAGDATPIAGDFNGDGRDEVIFYGRGANPDTMYRSVL